MSYLLTCVRNLWRWHEQKLLFPNYPGWPTSRQTDDEDLHLSWRHAAKISSFLSLHVSWRPSKKKKGIIPFCRGDHFHRHILHWEAQKGAWTGVRNSIGNHSVTLNTLHCRVWVNCRARKLFTSSDVISEHHNSACEISRRQWGQSHMISQEHVLL